MFVILSDICEKMLVGWFEAVIVDESCRSEEF